MRKDSGSRRIESRDLALALLDWHGGQFTPLYSLGSCMLVGRAVTRNQVQGALDELHQCYTKNRIPKNRAELKRLAKWLKEAWLEAV